MIEEVLQPLLWVTVFMSWRWAVLQLMNAFVRKSRECFQAKDCRLGAIKKLSITETGKVFHIFPLCCPYVNMYSIVLSAGEGEWAGLILASFMIYETGTQDWYPQWSNP